MKIQRGDGILKFMIIAFPLVVLGNTMEFLFVQKENLRRITGEVSAVEVKTYRCGGTKYTKRSCEKTMIRLENVKGTFRVSDYVNRGAHIDAIEKGDMVTVYIRKWYQYILTFGAGKDIYGLEKDGISYYDIERWKRSNVAFIVIFSIISLFFLALYILQRVTISDLLKGQRV